MDNVRTDPVTNRFAKVLQRGWWRLLLQGIAAIGFAIFTWMNPGISLAAMVILFGVYALADGILAAWLGIEGRKEFDDWWVLLLMALVGIGVAVITFTAPRITAIALLFYIAIWAIVRGALEIVAAIRLRREIKGEWLLVLAGVASILFGVLLMTNPGTGALAVLWLIALYAFVFGVIHVVLAFKARGFMKQVERMATV